MSTSNNAIQNSGQTCDILVTSLSSKLQSLSSLPAEYSIYHVPERLQRENQNAYNPQVVSIGPFHYGKESLRAMEEYKILYLKDLLKRTNETVHSFVNFVRAIETRIRNCYSETFPNLSSDDFVGMTVLDVAFIVEILCKTFISKGIDKSDRFFHKQIKQDMMLLENRIPFFLIQELFAMTKLNFPLSKIVYWFFRTKARLGDESKVMEKTHNGTDIKHFVDFFRKCHVPVNQPVDRVMKTLNIPSVTELHNTGVKFKGSSGSLLDINFCRGILVIPHLRITKSTQSFLLNILAFEQCHKLESYINDYLFVINRLIVSTKDVDLLAKSGAFESKLPDNQEVVTSVNNLVRGSISWRKDFNLKELCDGLNAHHGNPWNTWMAAAKHDYFSSPLTIFAVFVATALFILTLIQTVCSCGIQFQKEK